MKLNNYIFFYENISDIRLIVDISIYFKMNNLTMLYDYLKAKQVIASNMQVNYILGKLGIKKTEINDIEMLNNFIAEYNTYLGSAL